MASGGLETSFSYQVSDPQTTSDGATLVGHSSGEDWQAAEGDVRSTRRSAALRWLQRYTIAGWPLKAALKPAITILVPLILLPLALGSKPASTAYTIAIVAIFWVAEVAPIAAISLIPFILLPMFGVMTSKEAAQAYFSDVTFLFLGGILLAIAIETWNLHERIALGILLLIGSGTTTLFLGFMMITAFLSMWVSNTASAAMMLPIGQAVLDELSVGSAENEAGDQNTSESGTPPSEESTPLDQSAAEPSNDLTASTASSATLASVKEKALTSEEVKLRKGMALAVAYGAGCGGVATLTGTPTNLVLASLLGTLFNKDDIISFGLWISIGFPSACLLLFFAWLWLTLVFDFQGSLPVRLWRRVCRSRHQHYDVNQHERAARVKAFICQRFRSLGPIRFADVVIIIVFLTFVLLLFFRKPGFVSGWEDAFPKNGDGNSYVSDATSAILVTVVLFFIPSTWPFPKSRFDARDTKRSRILEWDTVHEKMPWGVILLLGAGLCMAKGAVDSGLSCWFGEHLSSLGDLDVNLVVFIFVFFITFFTEIASNTATATIFLPIFAQLAVSTLHVNPLRIMIPCAMACSLAYMLPASTPANAIAFSYGHLKVVDMVKIGFVMNLIGIVLVMFLTNTLFSVVFKFDKYPVWADQLLSGDSCGLANTSTSTNTTRLV